MNFMNELSILTNNKNTSAIKKFLEIIPIKYKGRIFEEYLVLLFQGNGWLAERKGGRNDGGADILLYHPKSPSIVSMIIQAKNHNKALNYDDTKIELIKFEDFASEKYNCKQYMIISINGFVEEAKKLEKFNMKLETWDYVVDLVTNYNPNEKNEPEIELYAHNKIAYENIKKIWDETNKFAVVQATGTGKSFIILKVLSNLINEKKLILAPTTYILKQLKDTLAWANHNTKFMTYAKLMYLTNEEIESLDIAFLVLDEFHRVGAEKWGLGVERLLKRYPEIKIMGTSATPIRYLDQQRDMSDELFENNIVSNLSLTEAIVKNILPMPIYISALYTLKDEICLMEDKINSSENTKQEKNYLKRLLKKQSENWENIDGIPNVINNHIRDTDNKFIIFCKDKNHLDEMEWLVDSWFQKAKLNKKRVKYRIISGDSDNNKQLELFKNAKGSKTIHLLFCIDMLNEGLHVEDVSGVILLRKTESPNIFYQQIGRAIQSGIQKRPLIFDFVNNFSSIRTNDFINDLNESKYIENNKRKSLGLKENEISFTIFDKTKNALKLFEEIENRLIDSWDKRYQELIDYKEKYGDCLVPEGYKENKKLATWVAVQRINYRSNKITEEKFEKLFKLGFYWNPSIELWDEYYTQLIDYKKVHGNCQVPQKSKKYRNLSHWVAGQRNAYLKGKLSNEKISLLSDVGFIWNTYDNQWTNMFEKLKKFYLKNGHCLIGPKDDSDLNAWINRQRVAHTKEKISLERINLLNSIEFVWSSKEEEWENKYQELIKYREEYGNCLIPKRWEQNKSLGMWVQNQRTLNKKGQLDQERKNKLDKIYFVWDVLTFNWEENYNQLITFKNEYGHCFVPSNYKDFYLANWVLTQRSNYKSGNMSLKKVRILNEIGFVWDVLEVNWIENYNELLEYKKNEGDCNIVKSNPNKKLVSWVKEQRKAYKNGNLDENKYSMLNELGFVWDVLVDNWNKHYEELIEYKNEHGDCRVHQHYSKNKGLGQWVVVQRRYYMSNNLSKEKIKKLNDLDFSWNPVEEDWQMMYEKLLKHINVCKSFSIPRNDENNLGSWVNKQRTSYRQNKLSKDKIEKLEKLEFIWEPLDYDWDQKYNELINYKNKHGDTLVSQSDPIYANLGKWSSKQRLQFKNNKLPEDKINRLNQIDFIWSIFDYEWKIMYGKLLEYYQDKIDNNNDIRKIKKWELRQKEKYKNETLESWKIEKLNLIKFEW